MKKNIFLMSLIMFLSLNTVCTAQEYTTWEEIKKIDDEVQACVDENYMSDYTMASCTVEGTKKYNAEIDKTLKAAKNYLSKARYKRFLTAQGRWEKYMEEYSKLVFENFGVGYPSYLGELTAKDMVHDTTRERLQGLSNFLQNYSSFKN